MQVGHFDQIGDLESVDSLCRGSTEAQYMQCLSIALLYLPCCEKDLQRQERRRFLLSLGSLGARSSKNQKGGSSTSDGVEVYTAEC